MRRETTKYATLFLRMRIEKQFVKTFPKAPLYATGFKCRGLLMYVTDAKINLSNFDKVEEVSKRTTSSQMCQNVHRIAWVSNSIPRFAKKRCTTICHPRKVHRSLIRRTKFAITNLALKSLRWSSELSESFGGLQEPLEEIVKSPHHNPKNVR